VSVNNRALQLQASPRLFHPGILDALKFGFMPLLLTARMKTGVASGMHRAKSVRLKILLAIAILYNI
jgi:hypothetical protein